MKKTKVITLTSILIVAILLIGYYKQNHLSIWGFNIAKNNLKDVIVVTDNHSYIIRNKDAVLNIAKASSNMEKGLKIQLETFPPSSQPKKYREVLIQTNDNTTYGGHLWLLGSRVALDSDGYYWSLDYNQIDKMLSPLLKNAEILN
jgi:hypothetical protein